MKARAGFRGVLVVAGDERDRGAALDFGDQRDERPLLRRGEVIGEAVVRARAVAAAKSLSEKRWVAVE